MLFSKHKLSFKNQMNKNASKEYSIETTFVKLIRCPGKYRCFSWIPELLLSNSLEIKDTGEFYIE